MIRTAGAPVVVEPHEAWKADPDTVRADLSFVRDALG